MPRTVLIIAADQAPADFILLAQEKGADEISVGIPPVWSEELKDVRLPYVHTEIDVTPPNAPSAPADPMTPILERLDAQQKILDLLLLGGLDDDGGTIDGEIGADLPDSGGTLDDLEGLDLGNLPDSGETLDDLDLALEG